MMMQSSDGRIGKTRDVHIGDQRIEQWWRDDQEYVVIDGWHSTRSMDFDEAALRASNGERLAPALL